MSLDKIVVNLHLNDGKPECASEKEEGDFSPRWGESLFSPESGYTKRARLQGESLEELESLLLGKRPRAAQGYLVSIGKPVMRALALA
jgi:hypothetical protein